jgi:translation initiation factor IF-3
VSADIWAEKHKEGNIFKGCKINSGIEVSELRVVGTDNEMLGVMTLSQALKIAGEADLDLVLINEAAEPPVAKIIDYSKFRYEQIKKEKEQKQEQRKNAVKIKEIQLSIGIQENEIAFKLNSARRFIENGDKVKVCINRIRGRKTQLADKGVAVVQQFADRMADIADMETKVAKTGIEGKNINIIVILTPKKKNGK